MKLKDNNKQVQNIINELFYMHYRGEHDNLETDNVNAKQKM